MLDFSKRHYLVTQVTEATKDSKKLFKIINNLLGKKNVNPLPPATDNRQLTEEFADCFLNKIEKKIREQFTSIQPYQPRQLDTTPLSKFASVTTSQLRK